MDASLLILSHFFERFGFWGMRAVLVLFLIDPLEKGGLGWSGDVAASAVGYMFAWIYLTPLLGGFVSDRFGNPKRQIVAGAFLTGLGIAFFCTAQIFVACVLVALGNGLYKPNVTCLLGHYYELEDKKRQQAHFSLYFTVLAGVFCSNIACGAIYAWYGPQWAFLLAAVSELFAALLALKIDGKAPYEKEKESVHYGGWVRFLALCSLSVCFFSIQTQGGGIVQIFTHTKVDRHLMTLWGSFEVPTPWFNSLGTVCGFAATALAWGWKKKVRFENQVALGFVCEALSFFCLAQAALTPEEGFFFVVAYQFFYVNAKVLITPLLWSQVQPYQIPGYPYLSMGIVMGSICIGNFFGGYFGSLLGTYSFETLFFALASTSASIALGVGGLSYYSDQKVAVSESALR